MARPASLLLAALLTLAATSSSIAAEGAHAFGKPLPDGEALPISQAIAGFDADTDAPAPRLFSGRVVGVCQNKGCWAMLEDDGAVARVMFPKHDVALPKDASGRATVFGVLQMKTLSREQVRHFEAEDSTGLPVSEVEYRIIAEGIEIAG